MTTSYQTSTLQTPDGETLFCHAWRAGEPASARGAVFIAHGIGEHAGRYDHVARAFNEDGWAVYAIDHRGHGRSSGTRTYFEHAMQPVQDYRLFFERERSAHTGQKTFLFGHSMGSIISLMFTLQYPKDLDGLILTGTATNVEDLQPKWLVMVGDFVGKRLPKVRGVPPVGIDTLSTDPSTLEAYNADPLVDKGLVRLGMGRYIINAGRQLQERAHELKLPLLIMHGADDQLTPPSGSKTIYERASSADKTLKLWEGMRHELTNERERAKVLQVMREWLMNH